MVLRKDKVEIANSGLGWGSDNGGKVFLLRRAGDPAIPGLPILGVTGSVSFHSGSLRPGRRRGDSGNRARLHERNHPRSNDYSDPHGDEPPEDSHEQ